MPETGNPRWIAITRAAIVIGIAAMVALIFSSVYIALDGRAQSRQNATLIEQAQVQDDRNTELIEQVRAVSARLIDCTEPEGKCYQKAQAGTVDLVGAPSGPINTVTALANSCADKPGYQGVNEVLACVSEALSGIKTDPPTTDEAP